MNLLQQICVAVLLQKGELIRLCAVLHLYSNLCESIWPGKFIPEWRKQRLWKRLHFHCALSFTLYASAQP